MSLPLLPGNDFSARPGRVNFSKSHHFDVSNQVYMNVGQYKPGIGGEPLPGQKFKQHSIYPAGEGEAAQAWLAFDRQVLSFDGYFHEAVIPTISREQFRIRIVKTYFYLEDDSIQVLEPEIGNSGIPQGTLIRRHRIPLPRPDDDKFYCFENFNVGAELEFYGKVFHLVNADKFTVNFLTKMGVKVGTPSNIPVDPHSTIRRQMIEEMKPLRPTERIDTLRQFLVYDRHVLRFNCYFDDVDANEQREMLLHYYLADDTLEIREVIRPNSGRDAVPVFVKRAKLPKNAQAVYPPGVITARTVLNVTRENHILDSLRTGAVKQEFYTDADLQIGNVINAWGRAIKLVDCDEFTKEFYRKKYAVESFVPIENKARVKPPSAPPRDIAPYNGFGSHEDSLANCDSLLPKPPKKNFIKFMEKDRQGMESNQLRFVCKLDTAEPTQKVRRFIVTYYLADDTISVFESTGRNTGVIGGKFLERSRVPLPNQDVFAVNLLNYYLLSDFYIGAKLSFNKQNFIVIGADDYALGYMEKHSNECPQSSVSRILNQTKAKSSPESTSNAKSTLSTKDSGDGTVAFDDLCGVLQFAGLNEHEMITLGRAFSASQQSSTSDALVAVVQDTLRKKRFDDFISLSKKLEYEDLSSTGKLPAATLLSAVKSFKLPIDNEKLQSLLASYVDAEGSVDYAGFVDCINYRTNPTRPSTSDDYAPRSATVTDVPMCGRVDYRALLSALES